MNRSLVNLLGSIIAISFVGVGCGDNEPNNPRGTGGGDGTGGDGTGGDGTGGDGGGAPVSCADTQEMCDDVCTNLASDPANCGKCGETCGESEGCSAGKCERFGCSDGQVECSGVCVDLQKDADNCGQCEAACDSGNVCSNGACLTSCPDGQLACSGSCVDPKTDEDHCGAITCDESAGQGGGTAAGGGQVCTSGETCQAGSCTTSCSSGQIICDQECVNPLIDRKYCGATDCSATGSSGTACESGELCYNGACTTSCPSGQIECMGTCVDPQTDESYCGASACGDAATEGVACESGERCQAGSCTISCSSGQIVCDQECVNPLTDRKYCGATDCSATGSSGTACESGELCYNGACTTSCPSGQIECMGTCVDPQTDESYCGASACGDTATEGEMCGTSELCQAGACVLTCGSGLLACDNQCIDPLGNPEYCGATDCAADQKGVKCATDESCVVGECREYIPQFTSGQRVDIVDDHQVFVDPSVAADEDGNAIAVWRQATVGNDFLSSRLYASSFDPATKAWSPQVEITTADISVRNVQVVMTATGNAVAVWVEAEVDQPNHLMLSFYQKATKTWSENPMRIDGVGTDNKIDTPSLAVDAQGDILVVWAQGTNPDTTDKIYWTVYSVASSSFSAPQGFARGSMTGSGDEYVGAYFPRAAVNDQGTAAVIWQEFTPDGSEPSWTPVVSMADISGTPSWSAPLDLKAGKNLAGLTDSHDIGVDGAGNVIAAYSAYGPDYNQKLYKQQFTGSSWQAADVTAPTPVDDYPLDGDPQSSFARVEVQSNGDAWVAYTVQGAKGVEPYYMIPYSVWAIQYHSGAWGTAKKLSLDATKDDARPIAQIASDSQGNTFVSWVRTTDTSGVIDSSAEVIRYSSGLGVWDTSPTKLNSTKLITGAVSPKLAVSGNGRAFVSWVQSIPSIATHLFVGRFD